MDRDILGLPKGTDMLLRDLIHERIGLFYDNGKSTLLTERLAPLVLERGFGSFLDYYYLLKYDEAADNEWLRVMDALSVQETYFWREMDQVRTVVDVLLPELSRQARERPLTIWSAACATGEEPLSLAIALNEAGWFDRLPIRIAASDGSPSAIQKAQAGRYRERAFRNLPEPLREKYFTKEETLWRIDPRIHARVDWKLANLVSIVDVAPLAAAPFVFCRNVFIYFSDQGIRRTLRLFAESMPSLSYLFVSASESLLKLTNDFELKEIGGAFVYQRAARDQKEAR